MLDIIEHYFKYTIYQPDHWKVNWDQLWIMNDYAWEMGVTPLSQPLVPFATIVVYLITIFTIQYFMRNRTPFKTNAISAIHNLILTFWSLAMSLGAGYYGFKRAMEYGDWSQLVCEHSNAPSTGALYFIGYWYYLSKYYELLDTIILVLRKRPLTFLHVYHHSIIIVLCYVWVATDYPQFWWTVLLNAGIHVFMYWYFFLVSLSVKIPQALKKLLTTGQIVQFCILAIISSFIVAYTISDVDIQFFDTFITPENGNIGSEVKFSFSYIQACKGNISTLVFSLFVNFTILMLFMNFFSKSYSKRPNTSNNNNKNKKQSTKKKKA